MTEKTSLYFERLRNKIKKIKPNKEAMGIFAFAISTIILAKYVEILMKSYKAKPPEKETKLQQEILEKINEILENNGSIVFTIIPHTSMADHIIANKQLKKLPLETAKAFIATSKFKGSSLGFAGMLVKAWDRIDKSTKIFYVTQAYLRTSMSVRAAEKAKKENDSVVKNIIIFLQNKQKGIALFFYPEGTRVKPKKGEEQTVNLARAHPRAFDAAEKAAEEKDIYIVTLALGDVPIKPAKMYTPGGKTEIVYSEPKNIAELRTKFEVQKDEIRFTEEVLRYHHLKNPTKKPVTNNDGEKQRDQDGNTLYLEEPANFGFADYVM